MSVASEPPDELWVCNMGVVPYSDGLSIQETLRSRRQAGELPDTLLLLEHSPVYTRGRRSAARELPFGEDFYRAKGIDLVATDRGGRVTFHGPGQLVGYPIMRIGDVHVYLRTMEDAIVAALAEEGIRARSRHAEGIDYTGVWVRERKIASIGVHVARGVTTHGFAVNVDNDLEPFSWVIACGLPDVAMTSIAQEAAGREAAEAALTGPLPAASLERFRERMAHSFSHAFARHARAVTPQRLGIDTTHAAGSPPSEPPKTHPHLPRPQLARETIPA